MDERLARENSRVLDLVQALLGAIPEGLVAASVEVHEPGVVLHFRFDGEPDATIRDEVDDIVLDFESSVGPTCVVGGDNEVTVELHVGPPPSGAPALPGRLVFLRRS